MTEIKEGKLKFYHRGLLSKKWKKYKFVLFDSSLLTWYSNEKHKKPDGMVLLKGVEQYICVGPYTKCLPDYPHLDNIYDEVALIAFPMSADTRDRDIVWLLCEDLDELNSWMKAIVQTLPSRSLHLEQITDASAPYIDEVVQTSSEENSCDKDDSEPIVHKTEAIGLSLAAGIIGAQLQEHAMNSKKNTLTKVGYDYGDTEWGTGDGWGYSSSSFVPGFAGVGGSGSHAPHIDIIRDEEEKKRLENYPDERPEDEVIEEVIYDLSKNEIADQEEEEIPEYHPNVIDVPED